MGEKKMNVFEVNGYWDIFFPENWSLFPKSSIPETVSFKERKTSGNTIPFQICI